LHRVCDGPDFIAKGVESAPIEVPEDECCQCDELDTEYHGTDEGCGFILFETLTTLQEIQGAARAVRGQGFDRFGIGLTCGEDGRTLAGVSVTEAVEQFSGFEPKVHFIQCTRYDLVERPLKELKSLRNSLEDYL